MKHIFLFHYGRSGSTVLTQSLSQLDGVFWHGEIFSANTHMYKGFENSDFSRLKGDGVFQNTKKVCDYIKDARDGYLRSVERDTSVYGCEIKAYHFEGGLFKFSLTELLAELKEEFDNPLFVFLKRDNSLRRIVSMEVARQKGLWHTKDSLEAGSHKITLNSKSLKDTSLGFSSDLLSVIRNSKLKEDFYEKQIIQENGLGLSYEGDIDNQIQPTVDNLALSMGVPRKQVDVRLKKTNPHPLSDIITNYAEIESLLKSTDYRWMLQSID